MRKIIFTAIIIAFTVSSVFAGSKKEVAEKMPLIIAFSSSNTPNSESFTTTTMRNTEAEALNKARSWIAKNHDHIRIISHSVTGNYYGRYMASGFTTVTVLYVEK